MPYVQLCICKWLLIVQGPGHALKVVRDGVLSNSCFAFQPVPAKLILGNVNLFICIRKLTTRIHLIYNIFPVFNIAVSSFLVYCWLLLFIYSVSSANALSRRMAANSENSRFSILWHDSDLDASLATYNRRIPSTEKTVRNINKHLRRDSPMCWVKLANEWN